MKINLQITFTDESTKSITCNAADLVAFEDKFNVSVARLADDTRVGWLLYLAWHSEKRTGATKDNYEKWLESVEAVGEAEESPK